MLRNFSELSPNCMPYKEANKNNILKINLTRLFIVICVILYIMVSRIWFCNCLLYLCYLIKLLPSLYYYCVFQGILSSYRNTWCYFIVNVTNQVLDNVKISIYFYNLNQTKFIYYCYYLVNEFYLALLKNFKTHLL